MGGTPRDPVALEELGAAVLVKVAKSPPKSSRRGVRFDAKAALEGFDVEVAALTKANADVRREKREEQAARNHRNEAWKRFDRELSAAVARLGAELRAVEKPPFSEVSCSQLSCGHQQVIVSSGRPR